MEMSKIDELSHQIIGHAIEVHRHLGPGLLESAYQKCIAYELTQAHIPFELEKPIPIKYKETLIDCAFRADCIVNKSIILEIKAVEQLLPIHEAQLLTYMKLTQIKLGILINFNVRLLKDGIKRMIL